MALVVPDPWPEEVVEQAVAGNLILVIGAGVSASSQLPSTGERPPKWDKLLLDAIPKLGGSPRGSEIEKLISEHRLLDAAELLRQEAKRLGKGNDFNKYISVAVDGKLGGNYGGSSWHEALVRLEPNIIVTTNYDRILERATKNGYNTHGYDSDRIAGDVRRGLPTLLKIHGTVDKIEDVILSRTDYTRLRTQGAHALGVLQALFLTRPALLLGYTLRDPDIQLLLENVFGGRNELAAHYMLAPDSLPDYEQDVLRYSYGVNVVTYVGGHDEGLKMLEDLADAVEGSR